MATVRWLYVWEALAARAILVARGFAHTVDGKGDIYAATPVLDDFHAAYRSGTLLRLGFPAWGC